jgi:HPt (histidine-containing phosphotransfer) domain-containing protein
MSTAEIINDPTFARLLDSVGGDTEFLGELMETYFSNTVTLFASMRHAVAAGDAAELRRAAHSLKSNSADFGALTLAALCKELEEMGKAGVLAGADERVAVAAAAYSEVQPALEARLRAAG